MVERRDVGNEVDESALSNQADMDGRGNWPTEPVDPHPQYLHRLIDLAKRHLYEKYAARTSSDDLASSVYRSVYRITRGRAAQTKDSTGFWRGLALKSLNEPFEESDLAPSRRYEPPGSNPPQSEPRQNKTMPTTSDVVELARWIEATLTSLGPIDELLLLLRVEGLSTDEVSRYVKLDTGIVRARLRLIHSCIRTRIEGKLPTLLD